MFALLRLPQMLLHVVCGPEALQLYPSAQILVRSRPCPWNFRSDASQKSMHDSKTPKWVGFLFTSQHRNPQLVAWPRACRSLFTVF